MAGNDFCNVQLTAAGLALAGGHPLRVTGRTSIVFTPGKPTRVAKYEWDLTLSAYPTSDGSTLFELVPDPALAPVPAAATTTSDSPASQAAADADTTKETE